MGQFSIIGSVVLCLAYLSCAIACSCPATGLEDCAATVRLLVSVQDADETTCGDELLFFYDVKVLNVLKNDAGDLSLKRGDVVTVRSDLRTSCGTTLTPGTKYILAAQPTGEVAAIEPAEADTEDAGGGEPEEPVKKPVEKPAKDDSAGDGKGSKVGTSVTGAGNAKASTSTASSDGDKGELFSETTNRRLLAEVASSDVSKGTTTTTSGGSTRGFKKTAGASKQVTANAVDHSGDDQPASVTTTETSTAEVGEDGEDEADKDVGGVDEEAQDEAADGDDDTENGGDEHGSDEVEEADPPEDPGNPFELPTKCTKAATLETGLCPGNFANPTLRQTIVALKGCRYN